MRRRSWFAEGQVLDFLERGNKKVVWEKKKVSFAGDLRKEEVQVSPL